MRPRAVAVASFALLLLALTVRPAPACRLVEFDFRPATSDLQIVIWVESTAGAFIETLYMTEKTARYGLGNRPGRFDFNSEWQWPYGRRTNTFPVWASRSTTTYPKLVFQDGDDDDLSHGINQSSIEPYYCRPLRDSEADAMTCATVAYTDKGRYDPSETSKYPPRNDMTTFMSGIDHTDMEDFDDMNDLDAISAPTPPGGVDKTVRAAMADTLPDGEYVAFIEISREFDQNEHYDFVSPAGIPWSEYGRAYRGQPSVLWRVPFTIDDTGGTFGTLEYAGYGPVDGSEGAMNAPDFTITTEASRSFVQATGDAVAAASRQWTFSAGGFTAADKGRTLTVAGAGNASLNGTFTIESVVSTTRVVTVETPAADESFTSNVTGEVCCMEGSGALRLLVAGTGAEEYRFRVTATPGNDDIAPGTPGNVEAAVVQSQSARIDFTAPGDDGTGDGSVTQYEIRYLAGTPITEANFLSQGVAIPNAVEPLAPGATQSIVLQDLMPETHYWVGIRASDECLNSSPLVVIEFVTIQRDAPPVDGCSCRAAPGSSRWALAPLLAFVPLVLARRRKTK
jgi:MYXO-CTERM domain-containing protein